MPNIFQARDIRRAIELYTNHKWIWFGPELTGGGHLPGPFYYYLIGLPIWLTGSVMSLYPFCFALASLAVALMAYHIKRQYSLLSSLVFCVIFVTSSFNNLMLVHFMNPSFLFFFLAGAFCCFLYPKENKMLALGAFLVGLSIQIHFVTIVLLIGQLLQIGVFEKFVRRELIKKIILLMFFAMVPLLPYIYFRLVLLESSASGSDLTEGATRVFLQIKNSLQAAAGGSVITLIQSFTRQLLPNFFLLPGLAAVFLFRQSFSAKYFPTGVALSSLLLMVFVLPGIYVDRYLIPLYLVAAFTLSLATDFAFSAKLKFAGPLLIYFCLLFLVGAERIYLTNPYKTRMSVKAGREIVSEISQETGWDLEYFRTHAFFLGFHELDDFSIFYPTSQAGSAGRLSPKFDGLFAMGINLRSILKDSGELDTEFLREKKLPASLIDALKSKTISCEKISVVGGFQICFYRFAATMPHSALHNVGFGYENHSPELFLNPGSGTVTEDSRSAVFYINPCLSVNPGCNIFFTLKLLGSHRLSVELSGGPLAAVSFYVNSPIEITLYQPKLVLDCDDGKHELLIANGIGAGEFNFLAPFLDYYYIDCSSPKKISLSVDNMRPFFISGNTELLFGRSFNYKIDWVPKIDPEK